MIGHYSDRKFLHEFLSCVSQLIKKLVLTVQSQANQVVVSRSSKLLVLYKVLCYVFGLSIYYYMWFLDAKLMERFPENESSGKSGTPVDFSEPHEWLAMLSSSDQQPNHQCTAAQQTPRMTPKKTIRPNTTNSEQPCGKISPCRLSGDEIQTVADAAQLPQTSYFQTNDESVTDNITVSVVVDVERKEMQLTDIDGNELSGMIGSLSVELESADVSVPASVESNDVAISPTKTSACGIQKCKTSVVNGQNCALKHVHSWTHSYKTGLFE